ncbi:Phosphatidylserine/phosphatidylglycerophosphate/cardiolipin synthase [Lentzea albidocapillata subsp. violacea]|uniref:Phosphatidylserine/phosphatidylglycerophosphate/cardiolipin synthase n=1 Tax=Lentzea albidocapillata subsp. violacea TaxID=128104 RepID=A0A1G9J6Q5_9PSEU|nr:phospholipase D family protein [Lentzea albidocapillata]SDL33199.1 Phosphatidylserine/phosphatidylglycerophosphate/cardiolipin synthase [Lentzea albidocapillata subsp. violacea]
MGLLDVLDARLGDGLENMLCSHHTRRLTRLGWGDVLTDEGAGWFTPRRPVQRGNKIEVLVDGANAFPVVAKAIENARKYVHIANWHASPDFRLTREPGAPQLRELLSAAAERIPVRVLLWAGPPFPMFEPTRKRALAAQKAFWECGAVRCELDARERTLHCHHEKIVIVDDVAFVGGLDMTAVEGDRHDSPEHPPRDLGWHDHVARLEGPVVAEVAAHFAARWLEIAGETLPAPEVPPEAGSSSVQLVRTIPEKTYSFAPHGDFSLLDSYLRALRAAESLIYVENQFLWSPEITEVLLEKLRRPPSPEFRMVLLLPQKPSNGADTTRGQLGRLLDVDEGGRLVAATLVSHGDAPVYVHAKLSIVDDRWMSIGSANLNEHSLFNDTEVNVVTDDAEVVRATRLRLWAEHLGTDVSGPAHEIVDRVWRSELKGSGRVTSLPGVSRRAGRLQGPLRGLLVDG